MSLCRRRDGARSGDARREKGSKRNEGGDAEVDRLRSAEGNKELRCDGME